jgi:hypothetical protein
MCLLTIITSVAAAQGEPPREAAIGSGDFGFFSSSQLLLTIAVFTFGLAVIIIQFLVIMRHKELFSSENILAVFTVPLIIVGTLIIVTVGFSANTLTPIMGFFGTVVGYLLGNRDRDSRDRRLPPSDDRPQSGA